MKKLLLTLLGALIALPSFARDFEYTYEGQTLTYTVNFEDPRTVSTKGGGYYRPGNDVSGNLIIPSTVENEGVSYTVTEIGSGAFYGCTGLTSVEIPNSVTEIGSDAFNDCTGITSIAIPNSIAAIGYHAFYNCTGLTKAEFANIEHLCSINFRGPEANPISYSHHLYINGEEITEFIVPESVTSIGAYAFSGCTSLTKAEFTSIEHLCSIKFGSSDANPLGYTNHLYIKGEEVNEVTIPESITSIGNYTFFGCSGLTSVTIPNSVTKIGDQTFYNCNGLTSVIIPNSVTEIGRSAFSGCTGLTSIEIPNSVTSIGEGVFKGCSGLTSVIIPNSVTKIANDAFYGCSGLTSITIPNSVTIIDSYAFYRCSAMTSVTLGNSVAEIRSDAFYSCTGLTSVAIPNSVTYIGGDAFSRCSGLTSVTIGNSVATIGEYAFFGCTGLTSVTLPNSVTKIGEFAFSGCSGLTSVTLPNYVTKIDHFAFDDCSSLNSVTYLAEEPIECKTNIFDPIVYATATLNYLQSAEANIAATEPWSKFKNCIGRDADFVDDSSISEVKNPSTEASTVYDMRGVKVGNSTNGLLKGIYIIREGSTTRKIAI